MSNSNDLYKFIDLSYVKIPINGLKNSDNSKGSSLIETAFTALSLKNVKHLGDCAIYIIR